MTKMNKMTKIIKTIKKARSAILALLSIKTSLPSGGLGWAFTPVSIKTSLPSGGLGWAFGLVWALALTSCSDFLYEDSDQVIYADDHTLDSDADTLWSVAGIMNKLQVLADRTILLGEVRADLVSVTNNGSADLRELAQFTVGDDNKYNQPRDYYAVINNCNFFIARADTALRNNRNELIFQKEYAAVKAFRAWTYLQLVMNYGRVPFITDPILTKADAEKDYPQYDIQQVCQYLINDITPYADTEMPGYSVIRGTDSQLFYYPIYVLLGDLYLWSGQYRAAAENYYKYISTRNGNNSVYPISTNAVRFLNSDAHWISISDSWSLSSFVTETSMSTGELITMIPGDSIPSEGNYSELRDLFNTNENNDYRASIIPSQAIIDLSAAQKYCQYTTGGEFIFAPEGLTNRRNGDLRLQSVYTHDENYVIIDGKRISNFSNIMKYNTRNVHLLRRAMVYLRMAEALNRAGFPRFAFQILKQGVNNNVIDNEVIPYYPADADWLHTFNFPNNNYIIETTAGASNENTTGLHSRGCGFTAYNSSYVLPDDSTLTDAARLQYQMEHVEDLITDEEALEFAFEGHRFYDLMRIALRRNDPAYLATRVARRNGTTDAALFTKLSDTSNWYLRIEN